MQPHNNWTADLKGIGHSLSRLPYGSQLWYLKQTNPQWTSPFILRDYVMFVDARGAKPGPRPWVHRRYIDNKTIDSILKIKLTVDRWSKHKISLPDGALHCIHKLPSLAACPSPSFVHYAHEPASPHQRHLFLRLWLTFWSPMSLLGCTGAARAKNTAAISPPSPGFLVS